MLPTGTYYARLVVTIPNGMAVERRVSNEVGPFNETVNFCLSLPAGWVCLPTILVPYVANATDYRIYIGTVAGEEDHYVEVGTVPVGGTSFVLDTLGNAGNIPRFSTGNASITCIATLNGGDKETRVTKTFQLDGGQFECEMPLGATALNAHATVSGTGIVTIDSCDWHVAPRGGVPVKIQ